MIGLSAKQAVKWSPPWMAGEDTPAVFFFKTASTVERSLLEAEADGEYGAGRVFQFHLDQAFNAGVNALLADDPQKDQLMALAASQAAGEPLSDIETAALTQSRAVIAKHWPDYRALVHQAARRQKMLPLLCFRRFVTGWEELEDNDDVLIPFAKSADGCVAEDALIRVPEEFIISLGSHIYASMYAGASEKNSVPLSKSEDAPTTSTSGATLAEDGK